jgi:glutamyl-tRNA synthetase
VLRGEDHISNTPKQLLLYDALGWPRPVFGHVPLIVGMDRARLSKRHGATKVEAYREAGVLPEALFNFLLLIGWSPSGNIEALANKELFSIEEAIEAFDPWSIGKSAGAFNTEKLEYFNGLYIRALSPDAFFEALRPFLPAGWLDYRGEDYAKRACLLYQEKLTTLSEIAENAWYFFREPSPPDAPGETDFNLDTVEKLLIGNADAPAIIATLYSRFEALSEADWTTQKLEAIVDAYSAESGLGKGKLMQPWRVALTGDKVSPGFYDLLAVLGRETVLARARPWIAKLSAAG